MNKVMLYGNVVADPELIFAKSGIAVCNFRIACNEWRKEEQITEFVNLTAFGKQAETLAEHGTKGTGIIIWGKLNTQAYEKDGVKKYITKVIIQEFKFVGGKKGTQNNSPSNDVFGQAKSITDELTEGFRDTDYTLVEMGDMPF